MTFLKRGGGGREGYHAEPVVVPALEKEKGVQFARKEKMGRREKSSLAIITVWGGGEKKLTPTAIGKGNKREREWYVSCFGSLRWGE